MFFPLPQGEWHGFTGEWVWVTPKAVGEYVVDNYPFHVFGISSGDIVKAKLVEDVLTFDTVISRSGGSTYRIRLKPEISHEVFISIWPQLASIGCSYESASDLKLYAINVPLAANVKLAFQLLRTGVVMGFYDLEEAHFGHRQN